MKKSFYYLSLFLLVATLTCLNSCSSYKKLPYFDNLDDNSKRELLSASGVYEAKIKPFDILSITVNSTIPGAAIDFNLPVVPTNYDKAVQTTLSATSTNTGSLQNYLVDKDGIINFPVLGKLKVVGLTTKQLQDSIAGSIYPRYISEEPVVNVRMLNFKVSVLGEVARPGVYESENGQMTILDAFAAAGDLTIYGKRNNVLLIRTTDAGNIVTYRIDMQDKNIVANKDIFYMQQNDKLYVETNKSKGNNSSFGTAQSIGLTALSIVISLIAIITR